MVSAIMVVGVESYLTARGAGHSHNHAHGFWDEDDRDHDAVPLQDSTIAARVSGEHGEMDDEFEDVEASHGLVAGASPMPGSTPVMAEHQPLQKRRVSEEAGQQFDDADSDLDIDLNELDPAEASTSRGGGQYASLKSKGRVPSVPIAPGMQPQTPEEQKRQMLQCLLLEAGILFHSVFIGMAISVATGPAFVVFLVAISFHQSFEGLALGSRIAAIQFPKSSFRPWLMVLAYGVTTPVGQAIGLIVHRMYDPQSMGGLLVVGFMNAVSSGLLLYAGLVQLLAEDFLTEKSYKVLKGRKRLQAYFAVCAGAVLMALVGAFA